MAALCYAEFAAMIPVAGSAYSYSYATMGELVGWIIGWDLILEYAVAAAAVAVGWSGYLHVDSARDRGQSAAGTDSGPRIGARRNYQSAGVPDCPDNVRRSGRGHFGKRPPEFDHRRDQTVCGRRGDRRWGVLYPPGQLEPVYAVRMERDHEGGGGNFFRLHRFRRGVDRRGRSRRSAAQSALGHHGLAVGLHCPLHRGRGGADRDDPV